MKNVIQDYAWGSIDAIPSLLGYDNSDKIPQAELWMGSHRRGASLLAAGENDISLADFINENSEEVLGKTLSEAYGDLPFLFKVLAAGSPLSIQVHPDKKQAEEGYARENSESVPLDAFNRNYKDDNHKPEIICALTDFWAMRGFRTIDSILSNFQDVDLPCFRTDVDAFDKNRTSAGLENFFNAIMALEGERKEVFIKELTQAVSEREGDIYDWVERLHSKYPEDAAIAAPLYLNLVKLKPGQALYLSAGELHAYLDGLGMELMASSDNVLRGGLTPKYIDRDELKRILNFSGADPEILVPSEDAEGIEVFTTPSREFELSRITLTDGRVHNLSSKGEVQILILTEGEVELQSGDSTELKLVKGESLFIPRNCEGWKIKGQAVLYRASVPGV